MESTTTGGITSYPVQTGMVSKFYEVVADNSCVDITNEYNILTSAFYGWNPAAKKDCTGLQADELFALLWLNCVGFVSTIHAKYYFLYLTAVSYSHSEFTLEMSHCWKEKTEVIRK